MTARLILPGDPEFYETLGASLPPGWQSVRDSQNGDFGFIVRPGSCLLEPVSGNELDEYLDGGEYDERLDELEQIESDEWWR